MDIERERLILEWVEKALEWPASERVQRLQASIADPGLHNQVLELLRAAETVDGSLPTALPMAAAIGIDPPPPERIGPYHLGELLGRGGMGRVFRADRVDGVFEQAVAIKLLRRTLMSEVVAEQFARERQILARLQHRNIAQLFDGGVTDDGQSYFIMELVAGRTITQYVAQQKLALLAMLRLFMQICAAVQYAHSRLVVHADIKPNNIVVTDDGSVKLLDFGVARVIADVDAGAGEEGVTRPLGLTYEYASPARRRGEMAATVDDVYSLGVLLDELLQTQDEKIPADLVSLCTRARAADANQRYGSVEELRLELQRWFSALPVRAHGGQWLYVASRFTARHRLAVAISFVAGLLLAGAATALAVLYVQAEHARREAEQRFTDVRDLSNYVLFDVYDRLQAVPRALTLRRDIAEAGQRYLDRLAQDPSAPMEVKLETIEGLRRLAQVQGEPGGANLKQIPQAHANLDRAEQLAKALPRSGNEINRALALARVQLTRARIAAAAEQDFVTAQRALDECRRLLDAAQTLSPNDAAATALRLDLAVEQSATFQWQAKYAEAIEVGRAAYATVVANEQPVTAADRDALLRQVRLLNVLAESIYYAGDPKSAEQSYRRQYDLLQSFSAVVPQDMVVGRAMSHAGWQLGTTLIELERVQEAEPILAQAQFQAEQLRLLEPDDGELVRSVSVMQNAHAQALVALKRFSEALPILERSVAARSDLWKAAPANWSAGRDYAISLAMLADARTDAGLTERACEDYAKVIATFERIRNAGHFAQLDQDHSLRLVRARMTKYCR